MPNAEPITADTIDKLTKAQRDALGLIAIGQDNLASLRHRRAVQALANAGLIEAHTEQQPGDPRRGSIYALPLSVTRYEVPINVHIAWCEWCSAHYDAKEDTPAS